MAAHNCNGKITAVELDEEASQQAVSNFIASPWADQFQLVNSAIQIFSATSQQRFDCIISNPPFFQQSFKGDDQRRNMARDKPQETQEETVTIYTQRPHYTEETRQLMSPYYLALY